MGPGNIYEYVPTIFSGSMGIMGLGMFTYIYTYNNKHQLNVLACPWYLVTGI